MKKPDWRYPDDWALLSLFVRFVVFEGKCADCKKGYPEVRITLSHDNWDEWDLSWENLIPRCLGCHGKHDGQENSIRRKLGILWRLAPGLIDQLPTLRLLETEEDAPEHPKVEDGSNQLCLQLLDQC